MCDTCVNHFCMKHLNRSISDNFTDRNDSQPEKESDFLDSHSSNNRLWHELNQYVDDLNNKKGADGEYLLSIPSNFDVIAGSMTRDDLCSSDEAPWSKYLLLEGLNDKMKKEYDGRYRNVTEEPDSKIRQGLAQIELMDRQLHELSSKADYLKRRQSYYDVDSTFVTKQSSVENTSGTPLSTHRTQTLVGDSPVKDEIAATYTVGSQNDTAKGVQQTSFNITRGGVDSEEVRLKELLDDSYDLAQYDDVIGDEIKMSHIIDSKLESYGRLDRLSVPLTIDSGGSSDRDHLTEQVSPSSSQMTVVCCAVLTVVTV